MPPGGSNNCKTRTSSKFQTSKPGEKHVQPLLHDDHARRQHATMHIHHCCSGFCCCNSVGTMTAMTLVMPQQYVGLQGAQSFIVAKAAVDALDVAIVVQQEEHDNETPGGGGAAAPCRSAYRQGNSARQRGSFLSDSIKSLTSASYCRILKDFDTRTSKVFRLP